MPRERTIEDDLQELAWWRHFATKIMPDGDMPKVGSAFYGERYHLIRDKKYDHA